MNKYSSIHPITGRWLLTLLLIATVWGGSVSHAEEVIALPLTGPAYELSVAAQNAFDQKNYSDAITLLREAVRQRPDVPFLKRLWLLSLSESKKWEEALHLAERFIQQGERDPELLRMRTTIRQMVLAGRSHSPARTAITAKPDSAPEHTSTAAAHNTVPETSPKHDAAAATPDTAPERDSAAATALTQRTLIETPVSIAPVAVGAQPEPQSALQRAYLALQRNEESMALDAFVEADRQGKLTTQAALLDAAFTAKRTDENSLSIRYFQRVLQLPANPDEKEDRQLRFSLLREIEEMNRRWGGYLTLHYSANDALQSGSSAQISVPPGTLLQAGGELFWRSPGSQIRNGTYYDVVGRLFQTISDNRFATSATGSASLQGYLGLRWKPISNSNFTAEVGQYLRLGERTRDDPLIRLANFWGKGTDPEWRFNSWRYLTLSVEYLYFPEFSHSSGALEGRWGQSYRLSTSHENWILTPFLSLQANYQEWLNEPEAFAGGIGIQSRNWLHQSAERAPLDALEATLQLRHRLSGNRSLSGLALSLTWYF